MAELSNREKVDNREGYVIRLTINIRLLRLDQAK